MECTKCLVSACLTGLKTRYDGKSKSSPSCIKALQEIHWIPVCPEQLGGLPTPRTGADIIGGNGHDVLAGKAKVIDHLGNDVTQSFIQGAQMVLSIAKAQDIHQCYFKARSPSCGVHEILGVTAALLEQHDITLIEWP